jgi:hypothetical protein
MSIFSKIGHGLEDSAKVVGEVAVDAAAQNEEMRRDQLQAEISANHPDWTIDQVNQVVQGMLDNPQWNLQPGVVVVDPNHCDDCRRYAASHPHALEVSQLPPPEEVKPGGGLTEPEHAATGPGHTNAEKIPAAPVKPEAR